MPIKNRFSELLPEITGWRRHIHANPELMFDTHETSAFVAERLREFGCDEVVEGIGQTGLVGVIRGRQKGDTVIGLRADMDALPITEATGLDYASANPGKMHACGHDGHTAMLLGAARYLAETRNFAGTVIVIFQPAEEGGGGARVMIEDGLLDRFGIQEVYGMHNWPGIPTGTFAIRPGPFFAATDEFTITVEGKGGHAAKPHIATDSILVGSQIVTALQSIVSRNTDPVEQLVVSVTSFETSSTAYNVLPQRVVLRGTVRSLDAANRDMAQDRLTNLVQMTAAAYGAKADLEYQRGYPVMVNSDDETDFASAVARQVSGDCDEAPLIMGGEDFAYMLQERPGAYIMVGNGDTAPVHHPEYNFNDEAIPAGCSWWAEIVEKRMPVS
ncbi:M20 aminoacylase family protein [Qingshengfaniella alkalisoli]|uniref:Amidohydrolase n=1 Tax=Qingshengfaniella alkalisoli TaxID=2599296 RepID=A0A5B8IX08_9RHOB|nr:M20 aminoacylase family protein [Qingshengfaniella alkalisoli]QDY69421.1 amidohydrolase [Qingshengfaniella alkalisoli]